MLPSELKKQKANEGLVSVSVAAAKVKVTPQAIYKGISEGRFKAQHVGPHVFVDLASVEIYYALR